MIILIGGSRITCQAADLGRESTLWAPQTTGQTVVYLLRMPVLAFGQRLRRDSAQTPLANVVNSQKLDVQSPKLYWTRTVRRPVARSRTRYRHAVGVVLRGVYDTWQVETSAR